MNGYSAVDLNRENHFYTNVPIENANVETNKNLNTVVYPNKETGEWNDPPMSDLSSSPVTMPKSRRAYHMATSPQYSLAPLPPKALTSQPAMTEPQFSNQQPQVMNYNSNELLYPQTQPQLGDYQQPAKAALQSSYHSSSYISTNTPQPNLASQNISNPIATPYIQPRSGPNIPLQTTPSVNVPLYPLVNAPDPVAFYTPPTTKIQPSPKSYYRSTIQMVPQSQNVLIKSRLPFGFTITPYPKIEGPVPVITGPIVRCRRCRSYINPFVEWLDNGARYRCNICFLSNDILPEYDYDQIARKHVERSTHPELSSAVYEFVATEEYMVRPPQQNVYLFLMDISFPAIQAGVIATAARAIYNTLSYIPNKDGRTRIGFITYDSSLHFYSFNLQLPEPRELVITDFEDIFLPRPDDLLPNLNECRSMIELFLSKLPTMYSSSQNPHSALGPALISAMKLTHAGGKIIVLQTSLPNFGIGALKNREDPSMLGTQKEHALLKSEEKFYKNLVSDLSQNQIGVDLFLLPSNYIDVASLSPLSKYTGGSIHYYPGFTATRPEDAVKFTADFSNFLTSKVGLEAVLRVRASSGINLKGYHGHFFLRQTDLLSIANVNHDHSYAVEMSIDDTLNYQVACFQTALLHTNSDGERRIRVLNLALPVTANVNELFLQADAEAITNFLSKVAVDLAWEKSLDEARNFVFSRCIDIFKAQKSLTASGGQATVHLMTTASMQVFAALILGLLKSIPFRGGPRTGSDFRSYYLSLLKTASVEFTSILYYPNFYSIHDIPEQVGFIDAHGDVMLPRPINLSSEKMERGGAYILDDGLSLYLWIGPQVSPQLIQALFGHPYPERLTAGKITLPEMDSEYSYRIKNIIEKIKSIHKNNSCLYLIKEDDLHHRMLFFSNLIEDRNENAPSYPQWLVQIREKVNNT